MRCRGAAREYAWDLVNGLWSMFLAFGLTLTALLMRAAHRWRFGSTLARQLIADYGAPLMVRLPTVSQNYTLSEPLGRSCELDLVAVSRSLFVWPATLV